MRGDAYYKMAIVVRTDLGMTKGKIAAQVAHGPTYIAHRYKGHAKYGEKIQEWIDDGQIKIVLRTTGEDGLRKLYDEATRYDILAYIVKDLGRTQLEPDTATCVAIGPDLDKKVDKVTNGLKLL